MLIFSVSFQFYYMSHRSGTMISLCCVLIYWNRKKRRKTVNELKKMFRNLAMADIYQENWLNNSSSFEKCSTSCQWCWLNYPDESEIIKKIWNASRFCVSSLHRGHANLLCIVPILFCVSPEVPTIINLCCVLIYWNRSKKNKMVNELKKIFRNLAMTHIYRIPLS
jgi:hypothetical protein